MMVHALNTYAKTHYDELLREAEGQRAARRLIKVAARRRPEAAR